MPLQHVPCPTSPWLLPVPTCTDWESGGGITAGKEAHSSCQNRAEERKNERAMPLCKQYPAANFIKLHDFDS